MRDLYSCSIVFDNINEHMPPSSVCVGCVGGHNIVNPLFPIQKVLLLDSCAHAEAILPRRKRTINRRKIYEDCTTANGDPKFPILQSIVKHCTHGISLIETICLLDNASR